MGTVRGCHFLCLHAFSHRARSFWCRPCCITVDPFFSELSSLTDDPDLYSLDLDSIQLFLEAELNFQPVQLFPDIKLPQATLCDPDQFLVSNYSLPPLPLNQDCDEQIPSDSLPLLPLNQDCLEQTPSDSLLPLPFNQDCVDQTATVQQTPR